MQTTKTNKTIQGKALTLKKMSNLKLKCVLGKEMQQHGKGKTKKKQRIPKYAEADKGKREGQSHKKARSALMRTISEAFQLLVNI